MPNNDVLMRAYSILQSLAQNLPDDSELGQKWYVEHGKAIKLIEDETGLDLSDLKLGERDLHKAISGYDMTSGEPTYLDGWWVERAFLMHKITAALTYFTGLSQGQEQKLGFRR